MTQNSSLTTPPVSDVLEQLLADAARTREANGRRRGQRPDAPPDSPRYWAAFREVHFAVSPETGRLLYFLARSNRSRSIVEFGTSFGVSTIYLAAALRDNGGGLVVGTEFEETKAAAARDSLSAAGLRDLAEIRVGNALDTLRDHLPEPVDLVLLDGAKPLYLQVLRLLEPHLAPQAVIVADNAGRAPDYLDYVRQDGGQYFSLADLGDDLEVSLRLGPVPA